MKFNALAAACTAAFLSFGPGVASAQAMPFQPAASSAAAKGLVEQAQYREFRPGWQRPGYRRGGPRVVCRVVPRRIVDRFGRTRIVREEVCRRRW